jgi:hypothetical protein
VRLFIFESDANTGLGCERSPETRRAANCRINLVPGGKLVRPGPRAHLGSMRGYVDVGAGRSGVPGISDVGGRLRHDGGGARDP